MTLTIQNGIIQDKQIGRVPLIQSIIEPQGVNRNARTLIPLEYPIGLTIHNTGNADPTADALAHAQWLANVEAADTDYIGAHFFIDAQRIVQVLPINEIAYHAGDGMGQGNSATIALEICETAPYEECETNAKTLAAALLDTLDLADLYTHQMWSGKYCPRLILVRENGWHDFVEGVATLRAAAAMPAAPAPVLDNIASTWAQEAIDWALANRFLVGDQTGNLRLHDPATREETIVILHRILKEMA